MAEGSATVSSMRMPDAPCDIARMGQRKSDPQAVTSEPRCASLARQVQNLA